MKIYRLLMLVLCVHGFALGMDVSKEDKDEPLVEIIESPSEENEQLVEISENIDSLSDTAALYKFLLPCINVLDKNEYTFQGENYNFLAFKQGYFEKISKASNFGITLLGGKNIPLKCLCVDLFNSINKYFDQKDTSSKKITECYDALIKLRQSIINELAKQKYHWMVLLNNFSTSSMETKWYQVLYRPLNNLPAAPWNEFTSKAVFKSDTKINEVLEHCNKVRSDIFDNKQLPNQQKCLLMLYLLTMRQLRIITFSNLSGNAGGRAKAVAAVGALVGAGALAKYFFGGKKAANETVGNVPPVNNPSPQKKRQGFGGYRLNE